MSRVQNYDVIVEVSKSHIDSILEVMKGNPWHGKDGRFTSGPGGSGAAVSSFKPATTTEEAREYAKTQLGFSGYVDYSYSYIDQKTMRQEIGSLDIDTVNHINKTITEIQTRYPELKGAVKNMGCDPTDRYAQIVVSGRDGSKSIGIGAKLYKDGVDAVEKSWSEDVDVGYHPKGTKSDAILWHEYGHVYAQTKAAGRDEIANHTVETGWKGKAVQKLTASGTPEHEAKAIGEKISRYATADDGELFAEAFAAHNTGNGTKWTKAIIDAAGADRGN